jgi:(2Fe-2S) ferredoxin
LPESVVSRLGAFLKAQPRARMQLIRKPERVEHAPSLFLARSADKGACVERLSIARHEDLVALDLEAFARGESLPGSEPVEELYLVCVHGKRDRCCAQHGMPLYSALAKLEPEHTWQTTHLGGHRFAATMLVLPEGVSYGRVIESEAPAIIAAHERGELYDLERLRGRTAYSSAAQAADYLVRKQLGELRLDGLTFEACEPLAAGERVRFRDRAGEVHAVDVARESLGAIPASCGAPPKPVEQFIVLHTR